MEKYLKSCIAAAIAGGNAVKAYDPKHGRAVEKGDKDVGHHAIVTEADYFSQQKILASLKHHDGDAMFMTEEHLKDDYSKKHLMTPENLDMLNTGRVYIIDELDGSSSRNAGHYEWSVSVGCVDRMKHVAGAVFAPEIRGGTMFFASEGNGAFAWKIEGNPEQTFIKDRNVKDFYVIMGPDCFLPKYPVHNRLVNALSEKVRTTNSVGSCALGMGLVSSGVADAIVQPLHSPWDWAAGKILVEEAGGGIIFYEIEGGKLTRLERLEPRHYSPDKRAVAFVAGSKPAIGFVDGLIETLQA